MKRRGKAIVALLCTCGMMGELYYPTEARVTSQEAGHSIDVSTIPGTENHVEEKYYDSSFLSVPGYIEDGVNDRSQYYEEYVQYNEEQKAAFIAAGGKAEDYVNQNTKHYAVAHNEAEFCAVIGNGELKVIELAADVNLGYKYLESLGVGSPLIVEAPDYNKGNVPTTSPDIIRDGQSKMNLENRNGLTIYSKNGSTIYHCEVALQYCKDVVIRNIGIQGLNEWDDFLPEENGTPGYHKQYDWDDISIYDCQNIWIDHCTLGIAYDGSVDITDGSTVTISWCEIGQPDENTLNEMQNTMDYMEQLYQEGNGFVFYSALRDGGATQQQILEYSMLNDKVHAFSCGEQEYEKNLTDKITLAYNVYKNSCQRVPQIRSGNCHMYNCYVDAMQYRKIHKTLSDASIGKMKDENGNIISPIKYAAEYKGCSTLGLCRALSALSAATIAADTCVFEGVIHPIISSEKYERGSLDIGATTGSINQVLIVNSSTQYRNNVDDGSDYYVGSSWDNFNTSTNKGSNGFLNNSYWNGNGVTYHNFKWAKWYPVSKTNSSSPYYLPESEATKLADGEFYSRYFIGSTELGYDYQIVPLDKVKENLEAYSGCGKVGMSGADWLKTEYPENTAENSVEFDFRDGVTPNVIKEPDENGEVAKPAAVREGYDFENWYYLDENGTEQRYLQQNKVSGHVYAYAKWTPKNCTITLELNGAKTDKPTTITCAYDENYNLSEYNASTMSKEGLIFQGWYRDKELTDKVSVLSVKGDTTLYAKWTTRHTLTCELNGGTSYGGALSYTCYKGEGVDISALTPAKTNYSFGGWYLDEALTQPVEDVKNVLVNDDMKVYAKWLPNDYQITFEVNGGTTEELLVYEYPDSSKIDLMSVLNNSNVTKEGYYLEGWYSDKKLTKKVTSLKVSKKQTVYAKWVKQCSVTCELNGGELVAGEKQYLCGEGMTIDLSEIQLQKENYRFDGWYLDEALTKPVEDLTKVLVEKDTIVYAKWVEESVKEESVSGDIDKNGKIDMDDAMLVLRAALKIDILSDEAYQAADYNKDTVVDLRDVQMILKKALHMEI